MLNHVSILLLSPPSHTIPQWTVLLIKLAPTERVAFQDRHPECWVTSLAPFPISFASQEELFKPFAPHFLRVLDSINKQASLETWWQFLRRTGNRWEGSWPEKNTWTLSKKSSDFFAVPSEASQDAPRGPGYLGGPFSQSPVFPNFYFFVWPLCLLVLFFHQPCLHIKARSLSHVFAPLSPQAFYMLTSEEFVLPVNSVFRYMEAG